MPFTNNYIYQGITISCNSGMADIQDAPGRFLLAKPCQETTWRVHSIRDKVGSRMG